MFVASRRAQILLLSSSFVDSDFLSLNTGFCEDCYGFEDLGVVEMLPSPKFRVWIAVLSWLVEAEPLDWVDYPFRPVANGLVLIAALIWLKCEPVRRLSCDVEAADERWFFLLGCNTAWAGYFYWLCVSDLPASLSCAVFLETFASSCCYAFFVMDSALKGLL